MKCKITVIRKERSFSSRSEVCEARLQVCIFDQTENLACCRFLSFYLLVTIDHKIKKILLLQLFLTNYFFNNSFNSSTNTVFTLETKQIVLLLDLSNVAHRTLLKYWTMCFYYLLCCNTITRIKVGYRIYQYMSCLW